MLRDEDDGQGQGQGPSIDDERNLSIPEGMGGIPPEDERRMGAIPPVDEGGDQGDPTSGNDNEDNEDDSNVPDFPVSVQAGVVSDISATDTSSSVN